MMPRANLQTADLTMFVIANLVNLFMIGIFLCRPLGLKTLERSLGMTQIALIVPIAIVVIANLRARRDWWTVALPGLLIAFLLLELMLDYVLKVDFRHTRLLGPYLGFYYLSLMGMIGYSFGVGKPYGAVTLATYFMQLLATWYSLVLLCKGRPRLIGMRQQGSRAHATEPGPVRSKG